uniref:Uncharacterized protein n=1 Tax=viral metagenome TaxID=1070528 RepID=A0A6H1ZCW7_9ZZZZ
MKKYLIIFLLLFLAQDGWCFQGATFSGGSSVGAGGAAPVADYRCTDDTHDSANNAISRCEDFEGASDCGNDTGNAQNCRGNFTSTAPVVFTTAGLDDTYSASTDGSGGAANFYEGITEGATYAAFFKLKLVALPAAIQDVMNFNLAGTVKGSLKINADGTLRVSNGTINATTTGALSAGSTYYIWMYYNGGTGTDGISNVAFSTTTTKPTICTPGGTPCGDSNSAALDTGDANSTVARVLFGDGSTDTYNYTFDRIRVNTSDFGSDPP